LSEKEKFVEAIKAMHWKMGEV